MNARNVPIMEVIERYSGAELRKRGREWWGLCPFHPDKSPSLAVNADKNVWKCWAGCGGGGSVAFLMKLRGMDFRTAAQTIETDFHIQADRQPFKRQKSQETLLAERIATVFDWCFVARLALAAELRRRGDDPPARMILDLGRLEIVTAELTGEPAQIVSGLALYRGWFCGKSSFGNIKVG